MFLIDFLFNTSGVWFPVIAVYIAWKFGTVWWMQYVNKEYLLGLKWVLLEIKLPSDVYKTPEAMDIILGNIFFQGGGVGSWNDRIWKGKLLAYTTLEIASIDGSVHFYIRSEARFRNLIETQIYSQYPKAEVFEVEDYTKKVPMFNRKIDNGWNCRAFEFKLDKNDTIPIKTYVDYGMDNSSLQLDEFNRIDPLTPMIEMLASLKPGENLWIQIFIRASGKKLDIYDIKDGKYKKDFLTRMLGSYVDAGEKFLHIENESDKTKMSWQDQGKAEIKKLIDSHSNAEIVTEKDGKTETKKVGGYKNLTPLDKHMVDIIQRSIMKYGFDTGARVVYYAPKDVYNGMRVPVELTSAMRQFAAPEYNQLVMDGGTFTRAWDFETWEDPTGRRSLEKEENMFKAYVKRAFYYHKAEGEIFDKPKKPFTLNTEELATIFHFPGRTVSSPSFTRIESQKSEPPSNLPI
jgi:hypothetical protein